ncbi:unnamed protein product (macronuclear) [Paramecium tetraurelia]|uniref:ENTH domain-containing protein n=1 Tax=Paramecium tetraurelia TaxID=5888 RepID=A0BF30_PARTE|nr:uncharacterized protein GSPATT00028182001 [Paramecium tetraurelia]CAK57147.1 unnamed protein product [Paramecium tetraurelia]|eukprot:XP_001424545.1 hypothetical protein (macronuclear) [Paramecium tetraurelia strain d4-2]
MLQKFDDNQRIQLVDIQQSPFNAQTLLQVILKRDKLLNGLVNWLHEATKKSLLDDKHGQLYLRIMKVCAIHFAYYQLLQGFNFIATEENYAGISNHFFKIFETEEDYKDQIRKFQKSDTRTVKAMQEEFEKRMFTLKKWKKKFMDDYEQIKKDFKDTDNEYIKFHKLKQQIEMEKQKDFDIYQYYFTLFYQEEWFKEPFEDYSIELLRLFSLIKQFLRLDTLYPIEQYANQSLTLLDINEQEKSKDYYIRIIKQK